jgi:hypothetical protein
MEEANGLELDRVLPSYHFDVIFMSDYLEHRPGGDGLPYTTKSRLPQHVLLVRAAPPAWLLFGKQTLYVGERPRLD